MKRPPPKSTLFPYTTLFRSHQRVRTVRLVGLDRHRHPRCAGSRASMSFDWTALSDKLGVDSLIRILNERMPRVGRTILRPPSIVVEPAPAGSELVRAPSGRFTTLVATGPGTGASNSAL